MFRCIDNRFWHLVFRSAHYRSGAAPRLHESWRVLAQTECLSRTALIHSHPDCSFLGSALAPITDVWEPLWTSPRLGPPDPTLIHSAEHQPHPSPHGPSFPSSTQGWDYPAFARHSLHSPHPGSRGDALGPAGFSFALPQFFRKNVFSSSRPWWGCSSTSCSGEDLVIPAYRHEGGMRHDCDPHGVHLSPRTSHGSTGRLHERFPLRSSRNNGARAASRAFALQKEARGFHTGTACLADSVKEKKKEHRQQQRKKAAENAQNQAVSPPGIEPFTAGSETPQPPSGAAAAARFVGEEGDAGRDGSGEEREDLPGPPGFWVYDPEVRVSGQPLGELDIMKLFEIDRELLPEAFSNTQPEVAELLPKGGCPGLQEEVEYTEDNVLLYRHCMFELEQMFTPDGCKQAYLLGPRGCGKSIALATLVHNARTAGWVVLYVPAAQQYTGGGFYYDNPDNPGQYDTPESAKLLMQSLMASHGEELEQIPQAGSEGVTLAQVARQGIESQEAHKTVDAALLVLDTLLKQELVPVMVAVDNYQALWARSRYTVPQGDWGRRHLESGDLRLARALRVLSHSPPALGISIAAATLSDRYPLKTKVGLARDVQLVSVPPFSLEEWFFMINTYVAAGQLPVPDDTEGVRSVYYITRGNLREMRNRMMYKLYDPEAFEEPAGGRKEVVSE
eukprot:jgi/Botrbrau1/1335/Bobra.0063s0047.2